MEELKKLFSHSNDAVVFTDCSFNILWSNKKDGIFSKYGDCCAELFSNVKKPLKSGKYELRHGGSAIECSVIYYPERSLYVLISDDKDILMSFLGKDLIRKLLENQSGAVRTAFSGMITSNSTIKNMMAEHGMFEGISYLDRNLINTCRMIRYSAVMTELLRYSDGSIISKKYDLADALDVFIESSEDALKDLFGKMPVSTIRFEAEYDTGLYINTDMNRLESCLLSLTLLTHNRDRENNLIRITAEKKGKNISLTFSPDSSGIDAGGRIFSPPCDMYKDDDYNADMLLVREYCKYFKCTLYINGKANEPRSFSLKIPVCNDLELSTVTANYSKPLYDKYHFFYSDIV